MLKTNYKDLLWELIRTNFKLRYNNSLLGFLWVLIRPFATFVILYNVWSAFRGENVENYQVSLLLGIVLYTFVNEGIVFGMNALLDKASIILKINFPREIAVMSSVAMALINLAINLVIFFVFTIFNPVNVSISSILFFLLVIFTAILAIYAISLFLSVLMIRVRDLQHIFDLFFQLMFWLTPIFYDIGDKPGQVGGTTGQIISLNPIGMLVRIARAALVDGEVGTIRIWNSDVSSVVVVFVIFLIAVFATLAGRMYFNANVKRVAEYF